MKAFYASCITKTPGDAQIYFTKLNCKCISVLFWSYFKNSSYFQVISWEPLKPFTQWIPHENMKKIITTRKTAKQYQCKVLQYNCAWCYTPVCFSIARPGGECAEAKAAMSTQPDQMYYFIYFLIPFGYAAQMTKKSLVIWWSYILVNRTHFI